MTAMAAAAAPARRDLIRLRRPQLLYALRVLLAAGALLAWSARGLPAAWASWWTAIHTPSAAGLTYDQLRAATLFTSSTSAA